MCSFVTHFEGTFLEKNDLSQGLTSQNQCHQNKTQISIQTPDN